MKTSYKVRWLLHKVPEAPVPYIGERYFNTPEEVNSFLTEYLKVGEKDQYSVTSCTTVIDTYKKET